MLEAVLAEQGDTAQEGKHFWCISTHYIKCENCGINLLKRSKQEALDSFMAQECINHAWQQSQGWKGHKTHAMWRRGSSLHCSKCNGKATQHEGGYQASQKLMAPCKQGQSDAQPSVKAFFQKAQ